MVLIASRRNSVEKEYSVNCCSLRCRKRRFDQRSDLLWILLDGFRNVMKMLFRDGVLDLAMRRIIPWGSTPLWNEGAELQMVCTWFRCCISRPERCSSVRFCFLCIWLPERLHVNGTSSGRTTMYPSEKRMRMIRRKRPKTRKRNRPISPLSHLKWLPSSF